MLRAARSSMRDRADICRNRLATTVDGKHYPTGKRARHIWSSGGLDKGMIKKINFRHRAREHFQAATELMETGDDSLLLTVALRLRMAIECLAYELLQSHQDEVDYCTMETWQPGRLIKELKEIDSGIESDRTIFIGVEDFSGKPTKNKRLLGTDRRLSASWIKKNWNALGSHLHEPTIKQHKDGKAFNAESARAKFVTISSEIDRVLASTLFATNIRVKISVNCECGFTIHRREELLKRDGQVVCASCKTIWGAEESGKDWRFVKLYHDFCCPICNAKNKFPAKELNDQSAFTCKECGAKLVLMQDWCVRVMSDLGERE